MSKRNVYSSKGFYISSKGSIYSSKGFVYSSTGFIYIYIYVGTARRYFYSTCMHTWIHSFAARIKASVLHGRWKTRGVNRNLWARFWVDEKEFTMYNILVHIFIHLPLSLYICIHTHTHIYIYTYISGGAVACLSYNLCSRTYVLPVVLCGHGHDHVYWFAVQRLGVAKSCPTHVRVVWAITIESTLFVLLSYWMSTSLYLWAADDHLNSQRNCIQMVFLLSTAF